jgi:uncharacterized RDD family membrane protein YckC
LKTCPECEYPNDDGEHRCEKCGIRFELQAVGVSAASYSRAATAENPLDFPVAARTLPPPVPAWRGEVRHRVRGFRERKGSQGSLSSEASVTEIQTETTTPSNVIRFPAPDASNAALMETPVLPPALTAKPVVERVAPPVASWGPPPTCHASRTSDVPAAEQQAIAFPRANAESQSLLEFPVASLKLRALAGLFDAAIIASGVVLFCAACYFAGGRILMTLPPALPSRLLLIPIAAVAAILPVLYLALFLTCAAATPGMRWAQLRLVDFDGRPATRRQRRRRVLASVTSLASILLGFLWATVDDERLTWHDRMSETCLTVAETDGINLGFANLPQQQAK